MRTNELVKLRHWNLNDLDSLVKYANNENIANNLADAFPKPYMQEDGIAFIERAQKDTPTKIFEITFDGNVVGSIGIFPETDIHRKNAAIAYWVAEPFWGRGIAPAAILKIIRYGFQTFEIDRIFAKPFETSKASHKALEKAGLTLEAILKKTIFKHGQYLDEFIYGIRRKEFMGDIA